MNTNILKTSLALLIAFFSAVIFLFNQFDFLGYDYNSLGEMVDITPSSGYSLQTTEKSLPVKTQIGENIDRFAYRDLNYYIQGYRNEKTDKIEKVIVVREASTYEGLNTRSPQEYIEGHTVTMPKEMFRDVRAKLKEAGYNYIEAESMIVPCVVVSNYQEKNEGNKTVKIICVITFLASVAYLLIFVLPRYRFQK